MVHFYIYNSYNVLQNIVKEKELIAKEYSLLKFSMLTK